MTALAHSRRRASLLSASDDRARVAMNRRSGGRGGMRRGGGGAPMADAQCVGIEDWLISKYYQSAADSFVAGAIGGFGVAMAIYVKAAPPGTHLLYVSGLSGSSGAAIYYLAGNGLAWAVYGTSGTQIISPYSVVGAGDVGQTILLACVHDGTTLRLYRAGAEVGAGTAITGYKAPTATSRVSIGTGVTGANASSWARIVGLTCFTGAPNLAAIQAWGAGVTATRRIGLMGGTGVTPTNRWEARNNNPTQATWVDNVAGLSLARTGVLTATAFDMVAD